MDKVTILEFVKKNVLAGAAQESVYLELLKSGAKVSDIEAAYASMSAHQKPDTSKRTVQIILIFAAVLVGAGIFSFIASNWQAMDKVSKILAIVLSMLGSYGFGWYLRESRKLTKSGEALYVLGSLIYGGGIFLIGQIFHIRANWPDGFILWMLGVLGLAIALEHYPLYALAILLGVIAIVGHPFVFTSSIGNHSFLLSSIPLLIIATVVCLSIGFIVKKKRAADLENFY